MPSHCDPVEECFYTHVLLHRASFDTKSPLHTEAFTVDTLMQRCFYTEIDICTRMVFNTQILYKEVFLYGHILFWRDAFTHWCFLD